MRRTRRRHPAQILQRIPVAICAAVISAVVVPHGWSVHVGAALASPAPGPGLGRLPDALVARLRHPDPVVRRGAIWSLGRSAPSPQRPQDVIVTRELAELLARETDLSTSLAAVATLATRAYPHSVDLLRVLAGPPRREGAPMRPEVQAAALQSLGVLGDSDDSALRPLLEAGAGEASGLSTGPAAEAAARAMAELPDFALAAAVQHALGNTSQLPVVIRAIGYRGDPRMGQLALSQLVAPSRPGTVAALETLARLHLTETAPQIASLVTRWRGNPDDLAAHRAALRALGTLGGGFDTSVVRDALADPAVRDVALEACGALGDPSLVPAVAELLAAPWPTDRERASDALGAIGSPQAIPALVTRAATEDHPAVRRALWHAVGRIGGREAVAALTRSAEPPGGSPFGSGHGAPEARWALAALALRGATVQAIPGDDLPARLVRALAGVPVDPRGLEAPSPDERLAVAMALGAAGTGAAALAYRMEREDDEGVRVAIALALGRAAPASVATGALVLLLDREAMDPSPAALAAASMAGRRGVIAASPALRRMLRGRNPLARAEAARALGLLGDTAARTALTEALTFDPDPCARGTAAMALASLDGPRAEGVLRVAASTAWTGTLWEMLARARSAARTSTRPWTHSNAVARLSGVPPRSVWAVALPDGGYAYGVAAGDGEALIPGVPSADSELQRIDEATPGDSP